MSAPRKPARGLARYVRPENALQTLLVFVPVAAAADWLDWGGTVLDHGCCASVAAMRQTMAEAGVTATEGDLRRKMGVAKIEQIRSLFDSERLCRNIEAAYLRMWEIHRRGERPRSFAVGDVAGARA